MPAVLTQSTNEFKLPVISLRQKSCKFINWWNTRSYVLCVMFCRSLFVLLSFFFQPLCCLFFFDIRILITPLVSSKSYLFSQVVWPVGHGTFTDMQTNIIRSLIYRCNTWFTKYFVYYKILYKKTKRLTDRIYSPMEQ